LAQKLAQTGVVIDDQNMRWVFVHADTV
jgi:hypothetical protein